MICPVRLVMCGNSMIRVRGVMASRNLSTKYSCEGGGTLKARAACYGSGMIGTTSKKAGALLKGSFQVKVAFA